MWIEQWAQPHLANNVVASICGATDLRSRIGLYGAGQIIAFGDSGLDTGNLSNMSADFQTTRLVGEYYLGPVSQQGKQAGDWSDISGHGTHVIGSAVGAGVNTPVFSGSNPLSPLYPSSPLSHSYANSLTGMAPEADIYIQSIGDSSDNVYPPQDLSDLFHRPTTPAHACTRIAGISRWI